MLFLEREQSIAILERGGRVVDRAWADDDEQPGLPVLALHDRYGFGTRGDDCVLRCRGLWDLVLK